VLDEPTRALLARIAEAGGRPAHEAGPAEARAAMRERQRANPPGPGVSRVEDVRIPGADGAGIPARVFVPEDSRAVAVFLHGGGWVLGDLDGFDHYGRRLAVALRATVVMPDYRLAPEHPHPAALEDALAAVAWASAALPDGPLLVVGESSGGNLAAAVARASDAAGIALAAQVLVYPVLDADFARPSYLDPENQLLVDATAMRWFWDQYVPDAARRSAPAASPLRGRLDGLPPTVLATAEHDVLRDEGEEYARLLAEAGVPVTSRRFDGQMHGFATMPALPASAELLEHLAHEVDALLRP